MLNSCWKKLVAAALFLITWASLSQAEALYDNCTCTSAATMQIVWGQAYWSCEDAAYYEISGVNRYKDQYGRVISQEDSLAYQEYADDSKRDKCEKAGKQCERALKRLRRNGTCPSN